MATIAATIQGWQLDAASVQALHAHLQMLGVDVNGPLVHRFRMLSRLDVQNAGIQNETDCCVIVGKAGTGPP